MARNQPARVAETPHDTTGPVADAFPGPADTAGECADAPPLTLKQVVDHLKATRADTTYEGVRKWLSRRLYGLFAQCGQSLMVPIAATSSTPVYGYTPEGLAAIVRYRSEVADIKQREANQLAWNRYRASVLAEFGEAADTSGRTADTAADAARDEDDVIVAEIVGPRDVAASAIALTSPLGRARAAIAERRKALLAQLDADDAAIAQAVTAQQAEFERLTAEAEDLEVLEGMAAINQKLTRQAAKLRQFEAQRRAELGIGGFSLD